MNTSMKQKRLRDIENLWLPSGEEGWGKEGLGVWD